MTANEHSVSLANARPDLASHALFYTNIECKFCSELIQKPHRPRDKHCRRCAALGNVRIRWQRFGCTKQDAEAIWRKQGGTCAICRDRPLDLWQVGQGDSLDTCIDHDHVSGKVRGLLCRRCNTNLSALERPGFVQNGLSYLLEHGSISSPPVLSDLALDRERIDDNHVGPTRGVGKRGRLVIDLHEKDMESLAEVKKRYPYTNRDLMIAAIEMALGSQHEPV